MSLGDVVVIGAGGHAKVVISSLIAAGYNVVAAFDDDPSKKGKNLLGVEIVGSIDDVQTQSCLRGVVAIGHNRTRAAIVERLSFMQWVSVVHPRAFVDDSVEIGEGTLIFAGAMVQPDAVIGEYVIINTGATVDHDCHLGDFVHVAPGSHLGGGVQLGQGCFLGIGSSVIPYKKIGAWATVGAGGVVVNDIPKNALVIGVPAKPNGS
jgi:sugar O-acyltransferase (sialic acid O-acetyltransferase NeuD family)